MRSATACAMSRRRVATWTATAAAASAADSACCCARNAAALVPGRLQACCASPAEDPTLEAATVASADTDVGVVCVCGQEYR